MTLPAFDLADDHYVLATRAGSYRHSPFDHPQETLQAKVCQDIPGSASNADEVLVHSSVAPFSHHQDDQREAKCPYPLFSENFAVRTEE